MSRFATVEGAVGRRDDGRAIPGSAQRAKRRREWGRVFVPKERRLVVDMLAEAWGVSHQAAHLAAVLYQAPADGMDRRLVARALNGHKPFTRAALEALGDELREHLGPLDLGRMVALGPEARQACRRALTDCGTLLMKMAA